MSMQERFNRIEIGAPMADVVRALADLHITHQTSSAAGEVISWASGDALITIAFADGVVASKSLADMPGAQSGGCVWGIVGAVVAVLAWYAFRSPA